MQFYIEVASSIRVHKPQALDEGQTSDENKKRQQQRHGQYALYTHTHTHTHTHTPEKVHTNNNDDQKHRTTAEKGKGDKVAVAAPVLLSLSRKIELLGWKLEKKTKRRAPQCGEAAKNRSKFKRKTPI